MYTYTSVSEKGLINHIGSVINISPDFDPNWSAITSKYTKLKAAVPISRARSLGNDSSLFIFSSAACFYIPANVSHNHDAIFPEIEDFNRSQIGNSLLTHKSFILFFYKLWILSVYSSIIDWIEFFFYCFHNLVKKFC